MPYIHVQSINGPYVDGASITYDAPRKHRRVHTYGPMQ